MSPSEYEILEKHLINLGWVSSTRIGYKIKSGHYHLSFKDGKLFLTDFTKGHFHATSTFFYDSGIDNTIAIIGNAIGCKIPPTNHKYTAPKEPMSRLVDRGWEDITTYQHFPYVAIKEEMCIKIEPMAITLFKPLKNRYDNDRSIIDRTSISDTINSINSHLSESNRI